MKTIIRLSVIMLILLLRSLANTFGQTVKNPPPQKYIILLDLSDRLLLPQQADRDKVLIQAVFAEFEKIVKGNFYIFSEDVFQINIIPQEGGIDSDTYTQHLFINLKSIPTSQKRIKMEAFKKSLPALLTTLYQAAIGKRTKTADFMGADTWRSFNDFLPQSLLKTGVNKLFILTDGYLDFESNRFVGKNGNRTTDSRMINRMRTLPNWQQVLNDPNEGIIPIKSDFGNLQVSVAEIHPKNMALQEQSIIIALMEKNG